VHERIQQTRPVAYTTVMTVLKNLAEKGYLVAERDGNKLRYRAQRSEAQVRGTLARKVVDKVFGGSPVQMVQALAQHERLSPDEVERLRAFIDTLDSDRS
jgi:predicted transcriptional regulator